MNKVYVTDRALLILGGAYEGIALSHPEIAGGRKITEECLSQWLPGCGAELVCDLEELHEALLLLRDQKNG